MYVNKGLFALFIPCLFSHAIAQNYTYTISTAAGSADLNDGGPATNSLLRRPIAVVGDGTGSFYVADSDDNRVRKVDAAGIITTFAGTGVPGFSGDGGPAASAQIFAPNALALDANGNLYISDSGNNVIREVSTSGIIRTIAGNGLDTYGGDAGPALQASFHPTAIALDNARNLYIGDGPDYRIRRIDTDGTMTTIAGIGVEGFSGDNGPAAEAAISMVSGIAPDGFGNIYFADQGNNRIRRIDPLGNVTTVAGNGLTTVSAGSLQPALLASLTPNGLAVDSSSRVYVSDSLNDRVERLDATSETITAVAGSGIAGFSGDGGAPLSAALDEPAGLFIDKSLNIFFGDTLNGRVRKVQGTTIQTVAGAGPRDGGQATSAFLNQPGGVALDRSGNLFIADTGNGRLRKVALTGNGTIASIGVFGGAAGNPVAVAIAPNGQAIVATDTNQVKQTDSQGNTTVLAGTGAAGFTGDGGRATAADLDTPTSVAVDAAGNVYIADYGNSRIRKVTPDGLINTIAGIGNNAALGDGGPAMQAAMDPFGIATDANGNLYVADYLNARVRKIDAAGVISTIAGNGLVGDSGSGGFALDASFAGPVAVSVDPGGAIYVADAFNNILWRVTPTSYISWIGGSGIFQPVSGDGSAALLANLDPEAVAVDAAGNLFVADQFNDRIRKLTSSPIAVASLSVVSGDSQIGSPSTQSAPLKVKVTGSDGNPYFGIPVSFAVTSGTGTLDRSTPITESDGTAAATVTFGSAAGAVVVTASIAGVPPVTFHLQSTTDPVIAQGGIAGAGLSIPPVTAIAPGGLFTIFGNLLSAPNLFRQVTSADLVNGALPTNLAGTCVEVGGIRAPMLFASPGQLNVQTPDAALGGAVSVVVITGCDSSNELRSAAAAVAVQAAAPEFFYFGTTGADQEVVAVNATIGAYIGPSGLINGVDFVAANTGDILTLYCTGLGAVTPAVQPGSLPTGAAQVVGKVDIQIAGVSLDASDVLYVGIAPEFAGLYQVNLRIPAAVSSGLQHIVLTLDGVSSSENGVLRIGN